ncbi:MAG TPA: type II toxin-antitoxin system VapC family toxin [Rhodothermales bacterium]|nr:type II toxin-antitoxin system VapC family toxin [Rhodothermales bacterium]
MGLIERLAGRRTYLDANVLIYSFEGPPNVAGELQRLFGAVAQGHLNVVTSELALAEMLVKPLREQKSQQADRYLTTLQPRPHFDVHPVTRAILVEAARLRAASKLKLPDAIHAATAQFTGCEVFLTNDQRIKSLPDIEVIQLSSPGA